MEYEEIVRIDIAKTLIKKLYNDGIPFRIVKVEVSDFDYSISEEWKAAKKESDKAYKRLKEIEFKLRHK